MTGAMLEQIAILAAIGCYGLAGLAWAVGHARLPAAIARTLTAAGLAANLAAVVLRGWAAGRLPFASQYEFALVFASAVVAVLLLVAGGVRELSLFVLPLAAGLLIWAAATPQAIRPLMPALQSSWLAFHVGLAAASYAAFGVAAGAGALYLVRARRQGSEADLEPLDRLQYRLIAWGYLGLTLTILTGAVWAYQAWGRYWGWDPKETWSLITWIVYSAYLHLRLRRGWSRRRCAAVAVAAFGFVMFTFAGVNLLLPGLHSYR